LDDGGKPVGKGGIQLSGTPVLSPVSYKVMARFLPVMILRLNLLAVERVPVLLVVLLSLALSAPGENWPCWRGPRLDGTSLETNVPIYWSAISNVVWKSELPGAGHAPPIVYADHIFTISATTDAQDRLLLCLDRKSGQLLWKRTVLTAPLEDKHTLNSFASSTPATDGELVYVAFLDRDQMFYSS